MLKKGVLALSFLLPLMALSATAQAGLTISDQRYWPSEARQSVQSRTGSPIDAFASSGASRLEPAANTGESGATWRYHGGPKSPW
jgi:hypothetical protein